MAHDGDGWRRQVDQCPGLQTSTDPDGNQVSIAWCAKGTVVGPVLVPEVGHDIIGLVYAFDVRSTQLDLATGKPLAPSPS